MSGYQTHRHNSAAHIDCMPLEYIGFFPLLEPCLRTVDWLRDNFPFSRPAGWLASWSVRALGRSIGWLDGHVFCSLSGWIFYVFQFHFCCCFLSFVFHCRVLSSSFVCNPIFVQCHVQLIFRRSFSLSLSVVNVVLYRFPCAANHTNTRSHACASVYLHSYRWSNSC